MKKIHLLVLGLAISAMACENKEQKSEENASSTDTVVVAEKKDTVNAPVAKLEKVWETDTTLTTSESVLFNTEKNILYVSNVNGQPNGVDKNGFISQVGLDGKIVNLKWITGLDAPKGMGVYKNNLYVTDITKLVVIDIEKGKIIKTHNIPGAKFLNDIYVTTDGTVIFSDSESNKLHALKDGKITDWLTENIKGPNGIYVKDSSLYLASMGSSDFRVYNMTSKKDSVIATGIGMGDGVEYTGQGDAFVVSNWEGQIFYISQGKTTLLLDTKEQKINTADIEYIPAQNLVLVPTFFKNSVVAYKLITQ